MNLQPHDATPEGKDQSIYVSVLMKRCTKALRLTATGYQGHERIIDFRLFCSRMIRTAGRGLDLPETNACAWWLETGS